MWGRAGQFYYLPKALSKKFRSDRDQNSYISMDSKGLTQIETDIKQDQFDFSKPVVLIGLGYDLAHLQQGGSDLRPRRGVHQWRVTRSMNRPDRPESAEHKIKRFRRIRAMEKKQAEVQKCHRDGSDVEALAKIFSSIKIHNTQVGIDLILRVAVHHISPRSRLHTTAGFATITNWTSARDLFRTTIQIISDTAILVQSLDIFWQEVGCCLASDELDRVDWQSPQLVKPFRALKILSLRVSDPTPVQSSDSFGQISSLNVARAGLAGLLATCRGLESLSIHYTKLAQDESSQRTDFWHNLVSSGLSLPNLQSLTLHGADIAEPDLMWIVHTWKVKKLTLKHINLKGKDASAEAFIDYIQSPESGIDEIVLDEIWDSKLLVLGKSSQEYSCRWFRSEVAQKKIQYEHQKGREGASLTTMYRFMNSYQNYGPLPWEDWSVRMY